MGDEDEDVEEEDDHEMVTLTVNFSASLPGPRDHCAERRYDEREACERDEGPLDKNYDTVHRRERHR